MKRSKLPSPQRQSTPPPRLYSSTKRLKPISEKRRDILQNLRPVAAVEWKPLGIGKSELYVPLTFPTGQTFRWKKTGELQYTGPVGPNLISLRQLEGDSVGYHCHFSEDEDMARVHLFDFLNMGISLDKMWNEFKAADQRFTELALYLEGARVLRQDPLECLIQFICSSNNNIQRITKMVDFISSKGKLLGTVGGYDFFQFPTLERLALVSEADLKEAGFGYRAKYIVGTVAALQSKPGGGMEWLASLRRLDLEGAINGLSSLPGVGPKVAACVALFSLDQHQSIPVDTHVWQIATRYLLPELSGTRFTPRMHNVVAEAFISKYGKYAGWAQTLLFVSELPSQKAVLPLTFPAEVRESQLENKVQGVQESEKTQGNKRKNSRK